MTAPSPEPSTVFAEGYEAVRAQALGERSAGTPSRGLALVLRHGLAAWLQNWPQVPAPSVPIAAVSFVPEPGLLPLGLHAAAAMVLADMALGQMREEQA